jgi:hypothetical protein
LVRPPRRLNASQASRPPGGRIWSFPLSDPSPEAIEEYLANRLQFERKVRTKFGIQLRGKIKAAAGGVADHMVTQMLRQGAAEVFKLYSQAKLGMMREALAKLDRQANERGISSTRKAS